MMQHGVGKSLAGLDAEDFFNRDRIPVPGLITRCGLLAE
jgi:hypothetical protein